MTGAWPDASNVVTTKGDTASAEKPTIMIGDVAASLLLREDPSEPVLYTEHPIEMGSEICDYAIDLPELLTLDLIFFSDPIIAGLNRQQVQNAEGRALTTWEQKRDAILDYKTKRTAIEVFTGYQVYPERRIEDIIVNRTPEYSACWNVSIMFRHIRTIKSEWAAVSLDQIPAQRQSEKLKAGAKKGASKTEAGNKAGEQKAVKEMTQEERTTFLRKVVDATIYTY